ncbi:type IV secretion system DNA-binding domain-containing protein [Hamadaea sp. NPDC050747]|uniref:type IV secretion system DNA-binding domain-containing protein n=1 Tax=Hamadaea sp. NPDC050747 TaxID=3155789 RepID=UPI0033C91DAC
MSGIWDQIVAYRFLAAAVAATAVCGWIAGSNLIARWRHQHHAAGARTIVIAPPPQVDPAGAADLWRALTGLLIPATWRRRLWGTAHIGLEYIWHGRQLTIALWVPGTVPPGAAEAVVRAAWPSATVTTETATDPIPAGAHVAGGQLTPRYPDALPLRFDYDTDPLRPLLSAGAQTRTGESTIVQILARPATARRARRLRAVPRAMRGAASPALADRILRAAVTVALLPITLLLELFTPARASTPSGVRRPPVRDPLIDRDIRAVTDKAATDPLFEVAIRYVVTATTRPRDNPAAAVPRLRGRGHQIAAAFAAHTGRNSLHRRRLHHPAAVLGARRLRRGFVAALPELSALAKLPDDLAVPGLDRARAKAVPVPVAVPTGGRGTRVLGVAQIGGHKVALPVDDARQHLHIAGKTGAGKSTLLANMVLADVHARRGAVVIDPRGDLILDILDRLPASAADRVVIIDPDQPGHVAWNPLEGDDEHLAVDNITSVFARIFSKFWGPRIDDTLRVSLLTLRGHANATLSEVPPLLNSDAFRARFTAELDDPAGLHGFWAWYDGMNPAARAQVIGPVLSRLRQFLLRPFVMQTIGSPKSTFDMGQILDGGLLLCRLPKGQLGEDTTRVLGSLLVGRVWQAATARAAHPEHTRRDATLYLDEAHNFLNLNNSVADMLAEARGYRLSMVLAHQHLDQLPPDVLSAIAANARSKLFFTVSPRDAKILAEHTEPELDAHDLSHLDARHVAARLLVGGQETRAFTMTTLPMPPAVGETTAIRQHVAAAHPPQPDSALRKSAKRAMKADQAKRAARDARQQPAPPPQP